MLRGRSTTLTGLGCCCRGGEVNRGRDTEGDLRDLASSTVVRRDFERLKRVDEPLWYIFFKFNNQSTIIFLKSYHKGGFFAPLSLFPLFFFLCVFAFEIWRCKLKKKCCEVVYMYI